MRREKSCGAVVFRRGVDENGNKTEYVLMIRHCHNGNFSFPKGHVEAGETEIMTAQREVFEETFVKIRISEKFRKNVFYNPKPSVYKEVVYFLSLTSQVETRPRRGEIEAVEWIDVGKAPGILVHDNDRAVFEGALQYAREKGILGK